MAKEFTYFALTDDAVDGPPAPGMTVKGVPERFDAIRAADGVPLAFWPDRIPRPHYEPNFADDNHFQGIQRLRDTNYVVLSGSDSGAHAHLFVVHMASQPAKGSWTSNFRREKAQPFDDDQVVQVVRLSETMAHAGGLSTWGDVLAVAVEGLHTRTSMVLFLQMKDPEKPRAFNALSRIIRPTKPAGAVALTRFDNGRYLAATHHPEGKRQHLDFYLSRSATLNDGWCDPPVATWESRKFRAYQNLNFLCDADGSLYLVGTHNTCTSCAEMFPLPFLSRDFADLWRVRFPIDIAALPACPTGGVMTPELKKVAGRRFRPRKYYGQFSAGAGFYVDAQAGLFLYACDLWIRPHGLHRPDPPRIVKFTEFNPGRGAA